VPSSTASI
jgi:5-formyltetrahydrofolate cyclo-ligase